jgi:hypothetical protein
MLLRCKVCNVLIGVRPLFDNWSADRTAMCPICAKNQLGGAATSAIQPALKEKGEDGDGDGQK